MAGACAGTALLSRRRCCCPLFASRSQVHQPTSVPPTHLLFASSTSESSAEGCIDSQAASPLTLSKSSSTELHWIIRPWRAHPKTAPRSIHCPSQTRHLAPSPPHVSPSPVSLLNDYYNYDVSIVLKMWSSLSLHLIRFTHLLAVSSLFVKTKCTAISDLSRSHTAIFNCKSRPWR